MGELIEAVMPNGRHDAGKFHANENLLIESTQFPSGKYLIFSRD